MVKLSADLLLKFAMGKVFNDNHECINSMDFHAQGNYLVTGSDDESLHLYDVNEGREIRKIFSKKYGVDLVRFTHSEDTVIYASKNEHDHAIRYLSLHDNSYLRYFKGHRDRVTSLQLCPADDTFLSASLDGTIRLWDVKTASCQGLLSWKGRGCVGYDPEGLVFATALEGNIIKLYDRKGYDTGPFATFKVEGNDIKQSLSWSSCQFSGDGKFLLLSTMNGILIVLDAFQGNVKYVLPISQYDNMVFQPSISPDAQFIACGSLDGTVDIWDSNTGQKKAILYGHVGPVGVVKWSPVSVMLASAGRNMAFWTVPHEALK